ncbi:MAG: helix-turn-helix transcriptional regulator [Alphaproteobacteria bacterium]|nr:helix-turn-helix transcriptional regulator [Alphaproteobacteria bacterium]
MAGPRRYKLLCPIARALDRIGDRWTLLILRDLHAGPARFSELQSGLTGIAPNLLTERLGQLTADGIIQKRDGQHGVVLYELTDLGRSTRDVLFELALFGGRFAPDADPKRPGNLRTIAVTLSAACQRVVTADADFEAELNVDGELFTLTARAGEVAMAYTPARSPDVVMTASYEAMLAASEGEMPLETFVADHVTLDVQTPGKDMELMTLLGGAMEVFAK